MPKARRHTFLSGVGVAQGCECSDCVPTGTEQNLQEMDFMRSACAAAQHGQVERIQDIIDKRPLELVSDGAGQHTPLHGMVFPGRRNECDQPDQILGMQEERVDTRHCTMLLGQASWKLAGCF